ncbi:hypothetical protein [Clostridium felsineum]|uniref:hypothetical protein n=1 Tax=Clostridium felsineum TaxID=36839 RepID=UPI0009CEED94|nr:hypothetical protein [Clostridium felsineum]URZ16890.1 hypothetical protein CLFE_029370 [Clostridium felsineum DSM 794]
MGKCKTRLIPKEDLLDIFWDDDYISDEVTGTSRWSIFHEMIFAYDGKTYAVQYSVGATELQDEHPFDDEGELVEVVEMKEVEVTVKKYVVVNVEEEGEE